MTKLNFKTALKLVAGSLVIALVVSILPGSFLVNAAEVVDTEERAKVLAFEKIEKQIDDELIEITVDVDIKLINENEDKPYYLVMVEADEEQYEVKVFANTGRVRVKAVEVIAEEEEENEEEAIDKNVSVFETFAEFEALVGEKALVAEKVYVKYNIEKSTAQAGLNELLRNAKLAAIAEFKETEDKELAKENFAEAKKLIKETKKNAKDAMKDIIDENEITATVEDDNDDKDEDDKEIVKRVKLTKEEALLIALNKVELDVGDVVIIDNDLVNDKNPAVYLIEFVNDGFEYKVKVQATTGKILDYEKEVLEVEEAKKDKEVKELKEVKAAKEAKEIKEDKEVKSAKELKVKENNGKK